MGVYALEVEDPGVEEHVGSGVTLTELLPNIDERSELEVDGVPDPVLSRLNCFQLIVINLEINNLLKY